MPGSGGAGFLVLRIFEKLPKARRCDQPVLRTRDARLTAAKQTWPDCRHAKGCTGWQGANGAGGVRSTCGCAQVHLQRVTRPTCRHRQFHLWQWSGSPVGVIGATAVGGGGGELAPLKVLQAEAWRQTTGLFLCRKESDLQKGAEPGGHHRRTEALGVWGVFNDQTSNRARETSCI